MFSNKLAHDHTPQAIAARLEHEPKAGYLREWVYGGIDGVVTTFAVVAGVAGADLPSSIILIIALAGLLGDGFSMAAGCYSGTKTEEDNYKRIHDFEHESTHTHPEGETEEIRQIFKNKGFEGKTLENVVRTIVDNRALWVETMLVEEYGLTKTDHNAWHAAFHTFIAFLVCGFMPIMPFVIDFIHSFPYAMEVSVSMAGITFFGIGALQSLWSHKAWWRHGTETFLIGTAAAAIAYGTGYALKLLVL